MTDYAGSSLAELRDALRARKVSARELAEAAIAEMAAARPLNAFITETPEVALAQADAADAALKSGEAGPLAGLPIAVKDLFCTEGVRTTAASRMLENFVPPYESTVTANLFRAGAVMVGKANLDEFAMGSSNENSHFGPTKNPWRAADGGDRVPGGSSGGSAAAVAAGVVPAATGTDTGGSIRQPAAYCGIAGIKPTYGRCSRWGIVAYASSLDQAGAFGRTVRDCALLLGSMAGFDPKDSTSVDRPVPDYEAGLEAGVKGLRIGVPKEFRVDGMPAAIEKLWADGVEWLKAQGAEIREISLPHSRYALAAYYIVAPAEASSNLARYDGVRYGLRVPGRDLIEMYENTRAAGFGAEVQRRILMGTYVLSAGYYDAYYLKAQKVRSRILGDFTAAWEQVDAVLAPTAPSAAFPLGQKTDDPVAMYLNDIFTVPASMAGLPAMSVPAGLDEAGLPLGLQVIGRPFDEEMVLRVGRALEEAAGFAARPQRWWAA